MNNSLTAKRLKFIMDIYNYKQVDVIEKCKPLCSQMGVKLNKNDLSQYVNGKVVPGPQKLEILSKTLLVDKIWLSGDGEYPHYGQRLKELRSFFNYDVKTLSRKTGYPEQLIEAAENDEIQLNKDSLTSLAKIYNLTESEFYWKNLQNNQYTEPDISSFDNIKPIQLKRFPMLGEIACGEPIFADEDREHYIMADMDIKADFCLTAKGDSMINARIYDGDVVFIRQTDMVENGEIAAVIIDDEATLKRVYYDREANFLQLVAENPKYKPLVYRDEQLDEVHILGKAVYFMSAL